MCSQNSARSSTRQRRRRTNTNTRTSRSRSRCKNSTSSTRRVNAEIIKNSTRRLQQHLRRLYSKAIKPFEQLPPDWRDTTIKVIYKSGDRASQSNNRHHLFDPTLYNLFSQLLFRRLQPTLDANWSADQAGFRRSYSTSDHFFMFQQNSHIEHRVAPAAVGSHPST